MPHGTRRALVVLCLLAGGIAATAAGDVRASILALEWRIPSGYERCAAIVARRDARWLWAWTANHCLAPYADVRFFLGLPLRGSAIELVRRSEGVDAALLRMPVAGITSAVVPAPTAASSPPLGTVVTIVGHPVEAAASSMQGRWSVQYGRLAPSWHNPQTGADEAQVYCPTCGPGDSGAGVFDPRGRLIGMLYGVTMVQNVAGGRLPDGLYADVIPVGQLP